MSDMSVSNKRDHQRAAEELKQEHDRKLQDLRNDLRQREAEVRKSGEAAINHIRANYEDRLEQVHELGAQRLNDESDKLNKSYSELRRRAKERNEGLVEEQNAAALKSKKTIENARKNETETVRRTQERLLDFTQRQQEHRNQTQERTNRELGEIERQGHFKIKETKEKQAHVLRSTEDGYRHKIETTEAENKSRYQRSLTEAQRRLEELRRDQDFNLSKETTTHTRAVNEVRKKAQDAIRNEQQDGEHRKAVISSTLKEEIEKTVNHNTKLNEHLQAKYAVEAQRIQSTGERDIAARQEIHKNLVTDQEAAVQKQLQLTQDSLKGKEEQLRLEHQGKVDHEVKAMEKMIHQQRNEFTERFGKAEEVNRETLRNQQETYLKALYKQKLRLDEKISTEKKRENDPFYAMKSFDAKLTEDQLNYTLRARIAPHERDNVEVRVKDDKVVLSARRQYEDSTKDKNSRLTTNSYQTHRQEFHLPIPVDQKRALKRIDDEGFITVVMPKKGYGKLA